MSQGSWRLCSERQCNRERHDMAIQVGDKLPEATMFHMTEAGPVKISTDELTAGKKVVIFALPGAFTPTCSAKHVPGFVANAADLAAKGVDKVACVSINDAFVMAAWGKDTGVGDSVMMLGDGNGEFTSAMGLEMDGSGFGLGTRSQRYAMIVDDGTVTELMVEAPGEFNVSSAESVLSKL